MSTEIWAALLTIVCGWIGVAITRSAKSYSDDAVSPVKAAIAEIRLDLARNYVRQDDNVMLEIRRDNKKLLRLFNELQVALAKRLKLTIVHERDSDADEE